MSIISFFKALFALVWDEANTVSLKVGWNIRNGEEGTDLRGQRR